METEARKRAARWALLPLVVLAGWALYTVVGGDREPVAAQDTPLAGEGGLSFAWPVPSDVEVTEQDMQAAQTVVSKYRIELREVGPGRIAVRKRDIRIVQIDNLQVEDPRFARTVAPLEVERMAPDLLINPNGDLQDWEPWGDFTRRVGQRMTELVNEQALSQQHTDTTLARMGQSDFRATAQAAASEPWVLWVNGWLGLDFAKTPEIVVDGEFPLPQGGRLQAPQTLRFEGAEEEDPGFVRLSMESRFGGPEVTAAVVQSFQAPRTRQAITGAEVVNSAWVVLLPGTMQPIRAETSNRQVITSTTGVPDRVRAKRYVFSWPQ